MLVILFMDWNNICSFPLGSKCTSSHKVLEYHIKTNMHCFANKELKIFAFSRKSETGTFLPLKNVFVVDKYVLLLVNGSFSFLLIF